MHCSWCALEATTYLLSDRDSHNSVDSACDEHVAEYAHIYRRSVPIHRDVIDLRERAAEVVAVADSLPLADQAAAVTLTSVESELEPRD